jgi:hypothetical protein
VLFGSHTTRGHCLQLRMDTVCFLPVCTLEDDVFELWFSVLFPPCVTSDGQFTGFKFLQNATPFSPTKKSF